VTYPWVDDPGRGEPEARYPWHDEDEIPSAPVDPPPIYRPGGERRVQALRRIDPWSVLKVSLVLYLCFFAVAMVVGTGLWVAGRQAGTIFIIEDLIDVLLGTQGTYRFKDGEILLIALVVGPILIVLGALVTTAAAAVYNVVARLTGGLEVTVKEED
jgi:hypothetical protein